MDGPGQLIGSPVVLLASDGTVINMNGPARRALGDRAVTLHDIFNEDRPLRALLSHAAALDEPMAALATVRRSDGSTQPCTVRVLAMRTDATTTYAIEIRDCQDEQFAALTERLRELNVEIAVRQEAQSQLEQAIRHNDLLYRELQHRVKNNLQTVLALVTAAGRETSDPRQKAFVQSLQAKLSALFDAQRLMYADQAAGGVPVQHMLGAIAETVRAMDGAKATIEVVAEPTLVPNDIAFPVALIANELLTNAAKHAGRDGGAAVVVSLRRTGGEALLAVQDNGPGFVPPQSTHASSGLGLVRGLCRQIGGRLGIDSTGTVAHVFFPLPEAAHAV
jgi:two-component sensor histidine kinase